MRARSLLLCTLMALCIGITSNGFAAIEEVVISAETIQNFGEISPENTGFARDADASNGLAFQWTGGAANPPVENPTAWFTVEFFCEAGDYFVWVRGMTDGNTGTDALWLQFDDQIGTLNHTADPDFLGRGLGNWGDVFDPGTYKWISQGVPPETVVEWEAKERGLHTMLSQPRQVPHFIDQILLSQEQDERPDDEAWETEFPRKDPRSVDRKGKLATTWGILKSGGQPAATR